METFMCHYVFKALRNSLLTILKIEENKMTNSTKYIKLVTYNKNGDVISKYDNGIINIAHQLDTRFSVANIVRFAAKKICQLRLSTALDCEFFQIFIDGEAVTKKVKLIVAGNHADRIEDVKKYKKIFDELGSKKIYERNYGEQMAFKKAERYMNSFGFYA